LTLLREPDISMTFISMTLLAGCERTGPMRTGTAVPKEHVLSGHRPKDIVPAVTSDHET
jgi:hypothetical protein